jgi:hypothetical protein
VTTEINEHSGARETIGPATALQLVHPVGAKIVKIAALAAGIIVLGLAYIVQARTVAATSEGASQALQAWDMLHGNILLRGWSLSDVSFYTTELPQYMLVEAVRGLNSSVVPIAGAMSYLFQVLLAAWLAKGKATGAEGLVRMFIAGGIMAAPPLGSSTALLMSSPDHAGTQVPVLLIYLVLDRVRPRWWVPILVTAMLAWAQIADPIVLLEATLPIIAVCVMRMYRRGWRLDGQWFDLSVALGAIVSAGITRGVLKLIGHAGGFHSRTPIAVFATQAQISKHFWPEVQNFLLVFGADFLGQPARPRTLISIVHLVGVGLVIWAVAHTIRKLLALDDPITQMLAVAFLVVLAGYLTNIKSNPNEIVGLLPIGAVLAGRVLANKIISYRLVPALSVVLAGVALLIGHNVSQLPKVNPNQRVASWLEAHHLTYGVAGFWNANSVTLESGNHVQVRPVRTYRDEVVWTNLQVDSAWYRSGAHDASFVIWIPGACHDLCLTRTGLRGGFGPPAATYRIGPFLVLVYRQNLLNAVHERVYCGKGWAWQTAALNRC